MKESEILALCREEMENLGWCQGAYQSGQTGGVCAYGALIYADMKRAAHLFLEGCAPFEKYDPEFLSTPAHSVAERMTRYAKGRGYETIPDLNDDPKTTMEDVLLMFKRLEEDAIAEGL